MRDVRVHPGVAAHESLRRCALRVNVWPPSHRAQLTGYILSWPAHCDRTRSMRTDADCRTGSAQVDRQGWASVRRGRGRPTFRRGGTWPGRRAHAQGRARAMPWEGMLGKCWNGCAMCWLFVQGWGREFRARCVLGWRALAEGCARASRARAAV